MMTTLSDETRAEITSQVRKMLYPSPLMHWMEGLANAERIGRISTSRQSVLRYGIRQFIVSQLPEISPDWKVTVAPMDDEVEVRGRNPLNPDTDWEVIVRYPMWLQDFLEEDENFELMVPGCDEKLGEVLQRIFEWCAKTPPYDLLVKPA